MGWGGMELDRVRQRCAAGEEEGGRGREGGGGWLAQVASPGPVSSLPAAGPDTAQPVSPGSSWGISELGVT